MYTDKLKMTPQEIFEYKNRWKPGYTVSVHSDRDIECKEWCRRNLMRWEWSMEVYTDVYEHTFYFEKPALATLFKDRFDKPFR